MAINDTAAMIFSAAAGAALATALLWSLRRAGRARRKTIHPPSGFLLWALVFLLAYAANRLVFPAYPWPAAAVDLFAAAALLLQRWFRKKARTLRPGKSLRRPDPEVLAIARMLAQDPHNAFCYELLSEHNEKKGNLKLALQAARRAAELHPTVASKARVAELEERLGKR